MTDIVDACGLCDLYLESTGVPIQSQNVHAISCSAPKETDVLRIIPRNSRDFGRRCCVERFIENAYLDQFGAVILNHYPTLLSLETRNRSVVATLGLREAADSRLFLERYFEQPVEQLVSAAAGQIVKRTAIVEIGNLASRRRISTARLVVGVAAYLGAVKGKFAVITATEKLRQTLTSFGFSWCSLGPAQAERLPDRGRSWGEYFRHDPHILVGAIEPVVGRMRGYLPQIVVSK
jgi:Thermostable hemolysin